MASQSTPRSSSGPVTRPLSPWAKRFNYNTGGRHPLLDDGEEHSGLAPQLPVLHPKYYADVPPYNTSHPTKLQLDHLFLTESFQRSYLKGLESWEVGPLMRHVWFTDKIGVMSGGHRECDYGPVDPTSATSSAAGSTKEDATLQIFHTNRIQVNENKWYKFLQKNRWYDLVQPEPILGGGNWSVDNPKVWEVLSISLELVDRMLKALVEDKNETCVNASYEKPNGEKKLTDLDLLLLGLILYCSDCWLIGIKRTISQNPYQTPTSSFRGTSTGWFARNVIGHVPLTRFQ